MVRLLLTSPDIPVNSLAAGFYLSHFNWILTPFSQTWVDFLHDPFFQALHTLQCKKQTNKKTLLLSALFEFISRKQSRPELLSPLDG